MNFVKKLFKKITEFSGRLDRSLLTGDRKKIKMSSAQLRYQELLTLEKDECRRLKRLSTEDKTTWKLLLERSRDSNVSERVVNSCLISTVQNTIKKLATKLIVDWVLCLGPNVFYEKLKVRLQFHLHML